MMESDRKFSLHVSRALDILGKSQDIVKFRVDQYEKCMQPSRSVQFSSECFTVGSKGEGLSALLESDFDVMYVFDDVICANNTIPFRHFNGIFFEADKQNTAPGYTLLRFYNFEGLISRYWILQSLFKACNGQFYLSSDDFVERIIQKQRNENWIGNSYRNGPSETYTYVDKYLHFSQDFVTGFQYYCPEIIQSFITRPRDYEWPTNDQLTKISTLEGHVVPIGNKGSETAFFEWRICYTKAELFLIQSLNDTQTKTYILLKMVTKTYISLVCKDITSYVLKNIVLWLAECCHVDSFKEDLLVDRLIQALTFLRKCVVDNYLPSYMIPERNLFSGKLDLTKRKKLVILLNNLINEGGGLLLGCERLRGTMIVLYKEPAIAEQYKVTRDVIEKMLMFLRYKISQFTLFTDDEFFICLKICFSVIGHECFFLLDQGHDLSYIRAILFERFLQWLS